MASVTGGRCDFCGKPVVYTRDVTGCLHPMCADETYPRVAPGPRVRQDLCALSYCPKHAEMGNVKKP
jgi:hypothetical protein